MKRFLSTKMGRFALAGLGIFVVLMIVLVIWLPEFVQPFLITFVIVAVLWLSIDFIVKSMRRKKQQTFDEKVAAKEGIQDRKREWESWTSELRKQGVDRYTLPFYLLLGEPQSGKSVLLHNSDLHFPFGQSRLSGIGGTRGCDWWFTEEAVILDLAGRLFTHEGGVADEAEWEAFLDLLAEFRPLCPANGILLVLPCDSLLEDSPDEAAKKVSRIQHALVTLTNRLQARLPVYVTLTKCDKIFGFAESVHRLEAEQRHQMFGWSREAELADKPFELGEVRAGFSGLVERARLLRAEMLSSARIPEAIPEIDRLHGFPEELEALVPGVELYLKGIFSESALVDRLSFRGLYLTSGLQQGAPIAKACAQMLGGAGEGEVRDLEGLFAKQRAYFIKDLIRKRMFSERGLVRPTQLRVAKARRNATLGYGAAAIIAIVAIFGSVFYLARGKDEGEYVVYERALSDARSAVSGDLSVPRMLACLDSTNAAIETDREGFEEMFQSSRDGFADLYDELFDQRLLPKLRASAEGRVLEDARQGPAGYRSFEKIIAHLEFLLAPIDMGESASVQQLVALVPGHLTKAVYAVGEPTRTPWKLSDAVEKRLGGGPAPVSAANSGESLSEAVSRAMELWDGVLTPGRPWQVDGELGYLLAWRGFLESDAKLRDYDPSGNENIYALSATWYGSVEQLKKLADGRPQLLEDTVESELGAVERNRAEFQATAGASGESEWRLARQIRTFASRRFETAGGDGGKTIKVPAGGHAAAADPKLSAACNPALLPQRGWTPEGLVAGIRSYAELAPSEQAENVIKGKLLVLIAEYRERFPTWTVLRGEIEEDSDTGFATHLVAHLGELRKGLAAVDSRLFSAWMSHLDALLGSYLEETGKKAVRALKHGTPPVVDWGLIGALRLAGDGGDAGESESQRESRRLWQGYLTACEDQLLVHWSELEPPAKDRTLAVARMLGDHVAVVDRHLSTRVLVDFEAHTAWLAAADSFFAGLLEAHHSELEDYWGAPDPTAWLRLSDAASMVLRETTQRKMVQRVELAEEEMDVPDLDHSLLNPESGIYDEFPQSLAQLAALKRFKLPVSKSRLMNNSFVQRLQSSVTPFENATSMSGPDMADIYFQSSVQRAGGKIEPPAGAIGAFLEGRDRSFQRRLLLEIRKLYIQDLKALFEGNYRSVMDALYAGPEQWAELDDEVDLMTRVKALMQRRDGQLSALYKEYKVAEIALRPEAGEAPGADPDWWAFDKFLADLQVFLHGEDEKAFSGVALEIVPDVSARNSLWSQGEGGRNWFCTQGIGDPSFDQITVDMQPPTAQWDFTTRTDKAFLLRWSDSASPTPSSDDALLKVRTSLAPLLIAWSGTSDGAGGFDVTLMPGDRSAPLKIRFIERELPVRPARPR